MISSHLLEFAREILHQEWNGGCGTADEAAGFADTCPCLWMLEDLLDLVAENPHRPVSDLEPVIHRMIVESQFIDDGGDSVVLDAVESADREARILVKVLERCRQVGLKEGLWSAAPSTPIMFG
ncbi:MAG: hypothetical protein WD768_20850 [Phycisphaeraceae bacterium]